MPTPNHDSDLTQAAYLRDPDDWPGMLNAYLGDVLAITGRVPTDALVESYRATVEHIGEDSGHGLDALLGFGWALCTDEDQRGAVAFCYGWLDM